MKRKSSEQGQALILIVFGLIGMIALTALAVDGGMAYSDRRTAQNAADNAALAAALAHTRGREIDPAALSAATGGGFNNNGTTNTVTVSEADTTGCPHHADGKDINVRITSHVKTYFGPIVGIQEVTNTVDATARSCESYY